MKKKKRSQKMIQRSLAMEPYRWQYLDSKARPLGITASQIIRELVNGYAEDGKK